MATEIDLTRIHGFSDKVYWPRVGILSDSNHSQGNVKLPEQIVLPREALSVLPSLSGSAVKVLLALGGHFSAECKWCSPGTARLMRLTGISRRQTMRRIRRELEAVGFRVERGRPGVTTRYRLPVGWNFV